MKKRFFAVCAALSLAMAAFPQTGFTMGGSGSAGNPYIIYNAEDLMNVRNNLSAHYKLGADINLAGYDFAPIGNEADGAFTGVFDGDGRSINNLDLSDSEYKYTGLFGFLEGEVKNIRLNNADIHGTRYTGGIAAYCEEGGNISGCSVSGKVVCEGGSFTPYAGGIVGYNNGGSISDCKNSGEISSYSYSNSYAGGIIGWNNVGDINSCSNGGCISSSVSDSESYAGGIVGYSNDSNDGSIIYCSNSGTISVDSSYPLYSYHTSYVRAGGIAGYNNDSSIIYCSNSGTISADSNYYARYAGGIVGGNNHGSISNCSNSGELSSVSYYSGGIAGDIGNGGISNCINSGVVSGEWKTGGITGYTYYGSISNCIDVGYATGRDSRNYASYYLASNLRDINGMTETEMRQQANFPALDFEDTWYIDPTVNNGFPMLRNMPRHMDLNKSVLTMRIGETARLTPYIDGAHTSASWSSADGAVASVRSDGTVSANRLGVTTVSAVDSKGMRANCLVYVYKGIDSYSLSQSSVKVGVGSTVQINVTKSPSDAEELIKWYTEDGSIATVDQSGIIRGVKAGKTKVWALSVCGSIRRECEVEVTASLTSLTVSPSQLTLNKGESSQLTIKTSPDSYSDTISWRSSDGSVASVSEGKVTALGAGTAVVSAESSNGFTSQCTVTVKAPAESLSLSETELEMYVGLTHRLNVTIEPEDCTDAVSWSSNNSCAEVNDGLVTARRAGVATITAKASNGKTAFCVITVKDMPNPVASVDIAESEIVMSQGDMRQLSASVTPADADNKLLSWSSSDDGICEVSDTGAVKAAGTGTAVIRAESYNGYYDECVVKVISASGPAIVLSGENSSVGGRAQVRASIVKNPGISGYKFTINYDESVLVPVSVTANEDFGGTFTSNIDDENRTGLNVLWYADDDMHGDGDLFTVEFEAARDVGYGASSEVAVEYGGRDICNAAGENIALFTEPITVQIAEPMPGDVYEDEDVTVYDLTLLSRYITGLEKLTPRQLEAGDVNNDGDVDIKDVVRLAQHIVGWNDVELMEADETVKTADIRVGTSGADENGEAYIPVYASNSAGIAGFRFGIDYDPNEVEILEITPGGEIDEESFNTNLGLEEDNGLLVTWYNEDDIQPDGVLFTLKVRYTGNAVSKIGIKPADNNMCDKRLENVLGNYADGFVLDQPCIIVNTDGGAELYCDDALDQRNADVIAARYDGGVLLGCEIKHISLEGGKHELDFENIADRYFIWDSIGNMQPVR